MRSAGVRSRREVAVLDRALSAALDCPDGSLLRRRTPRHPCRALVGAAFQVRAGDPRLALVLGSGAVRAAYATGQRDLALALAPASEARTLIVGRRGHRSYFRAAGVAEALALAPLWAGETFGVACAALEQAGSDPAQIVAALRGWLEAGMIAAPT